MLVASIFTGTVFQGELKGKGAVAVKTVRSTKITMASVREFMAEIKVGRLSLVPPLLSVRRSYTNFA